LLDQLGRLRHAIEDPATENPATEGRPWALSWLLTMPPENPFADQIVELRIAAAIATVSAEALDQRVRR
jgi:hypothetical protein